MDQQDQNYIRSKETWFVPGAIVVAGIILAIATYSLRANHPEGNVVGNPALMDPITEVDHMLGSPEAPVKLVEYADMDSSYSKTFQSTMQQLMADYASDGQVAWIYRHLPLVDQHVHAETNAEAAECIASLGGPNIFWKFIDTIHARSPGDLEFNPVNYDSVVTSLGILPQSFNACMTAHTYQKKVADNFANGLAVGAGGTPFSILLVKGQPPITLDGAIPYDAMKKILDEAIKKANASQ